MEQQVAKRPRGRPRKPPLTPDQEKWIESCASFGIPIEHIAKLVNLKAETIRNRYAELLELAESKMIATVANSLYFQAVGRSAIYDNKGNKLRDEQKPQRGAAEFILARRARWRETDPPPASDGTITIRVIGGLPDDGEVYE